jgi:hypothetical protein
MIVSQALERWFESSNDDIEDEDSRMSQVSNLMSDVSIDTAAGEWDPQEEGEYM